MMVTGRGTADGSSMIIAGTTTETETGAVTEIGITTGMTATGITSVTTKGITTANSAPTTPSL